jgi:hypothetical protein
MLTVGHTLSNSDSVQQTLNSRHLEEAIFKMSAVQRLLYAVAMSLEAGRMVGSPKQKGRHFWRPFFRSER